MFQYDDEAYCFEVKTDIPRTLKKKKKLGTSLPGTGEVSLDGSSELAATAFPPFVAEAFSTPVPAATMIAVGMLFLLLLLLLGPFGVKLPFIERSLSECRDVCVATLCMTAELDVVEIVEEAPNEPCWRDIWSVDGCEVLVNDNTSSATCTVIYREWHTFVN